MRRSAGSLADRAQQPEAVEPGHHHVGAGRGRAADAANRRERGGSVGDGLDVPALAQQAGQVVAHVGVVVGEHDPCARARARRSRAPCFSGRGEAPPFGRRVQRSASSTYGRDADGRRRQASARRRSGRPAGGRWPRGRRTEKVVPAPFVALHPHAPAVQLGQLGHQRQADARALVGPCARALDPMKAIEHVGQLRGRDADPGVPHDQLEVGAVAAAARRRSLPRT